MGVSIMGVAAFRSGFWEFVDATAEQVKAMPDALKGGTPRSGQAELRHAAFDYGETVTLRCGRGHIRQERMCPACHDVMFAYGRWAAGKGEAYDLGWKDGYREGYADARDD